MTQANPLAALSPLDGRYQALVSDLANLFSEAALIKNRLKIEVEYFIFLIDKKIAPKISQTQRVQLQKIVEKFDLAEAEKIKIIEQTTKHDVKAIEYYLRQKFADLQIPGSEWLHFGLTSEDVNSLAYGLSLAAANLTVILPALKKLLIQLQLMILKNRAVPMLARTHGQPAVPTTVGKELLVFGLRLVPLFAELQRFQFEGKLTGAVGNFNALQLAYPDRDWLNLSQDFVASLGLKPNLFTTQILPPENYLRYFQTLQLVNGVLLDMAQDLWRYTSDGLFGQMLTKGQVGSSTMPQKINPIDFENCEGNLGLANALFSHFMQKLPVSRLQRDLSDSTVKRSFGVALGYCLLGYSVCERGLKKITVNETALRAQLNNHWEIVTEGIQTMLRVAGDETAYDKLRIFSQGQKISPLEVRQFIESLDLPTDICQKLLNLSPENYLGAVQPIIDLGLERMQYAISEK